MGIAQTYCGCCKQKKVEKKPLIEVHSKPAPRHEVIVEAPRAQANTRVEYGEPRITYGQSTVQEYRDHQPSHMERRHVETRQLSPDRQHEVLYRQEVIGPRNQESENKTTSDMNQDKDVL